MYKALITDLDGTAVAISSFGEDIDQATKESVKLAIKSGKKIACATGREWEAAKNIVKELGFISPCIIEGGTRIIDPLTEKTIWQKPLDDGAASHILKVFKTDSVKGLIMHSDDISQINISEVSVLPHSLRFLYFIAVAEEPAVKICNQINSTDYAVAHFTPSWKGEGKVDIHVTHPEATKEHAILKWQELEDIKKEETIGMGDSGNDLPIFLASGYKVAVSNATNELKNLADYIIPSLDSNALHHVIENKLMNS